MDNDTAAEEPSNIIKFEQLGKWKFSGEDGTTSNSGPANTLAWMTDDKGKPVNNLANVLVALRHDPKLSDAVILDEMLQTVCVMKPLSSIDESTDTFIPRPITDHDVTRIQEYLQHIGLRRVGRDLVHQGVDARAQENRRHPVREWLFSLKWDGVPRTEAWLKTYLGANQTLYASRVGEMVLIAMVARIMEPGCKADHMMVMEGPQGIGKSSVCKILGGRWFSDSLPDVTGNKDALVHLAGKWIIEAPEMSAMTKAETHRLKAFLSGTKDQYRPHYGRKEIKQPRQCVFIGTTNQTTYLKDETGGRRYWPVKVGKIDLDALEKDRDQLFAEAVQLYRAKCPWHPPLDFEKKYILPEQEARYETDPWEPAIRAYMQEKKPEKIYLGELFKNVLNIELSSRERGKQNRMTAILVRIGWSRLPRDSKGNIPWGPPT